jgi:hypothetical protein
MVSCDRLAVVNEFADAELGDARRTKRLMAIARSLAEDPSLSFPVAAGSDGVLEGTYRFLGNTAVSPECVLGGHFQRTVERAAAFETVIAVHDTSNFEFSGEVTREGLGHLRGTGQGFLGHLSLLLSPEQNRRPLGVLSLVTVFRGAPARRKRTARELREDPHRESKRWREGVENVEARLNGCTSAIHVMDREGDAYELLAGLITAGRRFVIRAAHDRTLSRRENASGRGKLSRVLSNAQPLVERVVPLSRRRKQRSLSAQKIHPPRTGRLARLALSGETVELQRSCHLSPHLPATITLNVVHVREIETHGDHEPVEWILFTNEPVSTAEQLERVVDFYRARWAIEEYFKALKTGCAYEKRQLESKHTLLNALAVFIPLAWQLLVLRTIARAEESVPASDVLAESQIQVLVATSRKALPSNPTAHDALLAIAALGGHLKSNGAPGWQVLWRGFQKLRLFELGWLACVRTQAKSAGKCDR